MRIEVNTFPPTGCMISSKKVVKVGDGSTSVSQLSAALRQYIDEVGDKGYQTIVMERWKVAAQTPLDGVSFAVRCADGTTDIYVLRTPTK